MTQKGLQAGPRLDAGPGGSGVMARAGGNGMAKLLAERASKAVADTHSAIGAMKSDAEMLELKGALESVLCDSGAQSLREVPADIIPLRCRGDPFELGKLTNMLEAVSDCRDYVSMELSRRGVPHVENPRAWNGY